MTISDSLLSPAVETLADILDGEIVTADRRLYGDPADLAIAMTFTALLLARTVAHHEGLDLRAWLQGWAAEVAAARAVDPNPPSGDERWFSDHIEVKHISTE